MKKLLMLARLDDKMINNSPLAVNWGIVSKWSEDVRYESSASRAGAIEMFNAVTDATNGVLPWLKNYW